MAENPDKKSPTDDSKTPKFNCAELPDDPKPPELKEPDKCDPHCNCPSPPPATTNCFDDLIKEQNRLVNQADRAKKSMADLQAMLDNGNTATKSYTRDKYKEFQDRWLKQDGQIVSVIQTVTCNLKCWECVIECHICPLLYRIREIEGLLDGPSDNNFAVVSPVHSLLALQYWHQRNFDRKTRIFNRIDEVMKAWSDPAKSIDAALNANDQILKAIPTKDRVDDVVQVLLQLVPRHLSIAPRPIDNPRKIDTGIDKKYIELCGDCDPAAPDDCCGPDVGWPTARQRLIGPQAYIIDPNYYFPTLCCLATNRYQPAKEQLETAKSDLDDVTNRIGTLTAEFATRAANPLADYRTSISAEIDCKDYQPKNGGGGCGDETQNADSAR